MTLLRQRIATFCRSVFSSRVLLPLVAAIAFAAPAHAQQTGDISGNVTDASGSAVAGVTVEATSNVLPQDRSATTTVNGQYRLRRLPPGQYELRFEFADGSTTTRTAFVQLQQTTEVDVMANAGAQVEEIVVTGSALIADTGQGSLANAISAQTVDALPVGQEYRDLFKLIPGVQYSELDIRGPSAGGSGQDNVYQFDGVDVSLPLFGVLGSEPSSHDIAQVSIVRGGAKAIGFNRAGGFLMNTVSKTGTDEFKAELSYQIEPSSLIADLDNGESLEQFEEDRSWIVASLGGPILRDRLYFYTSYFGPDFERSNTQNAYGPVGDFTNKRDEFFAKLTFAPTDSILFDASFRTSDREVENDSVGEFESATASLGSEATQDIIIVEGSWLIDEQSSVSFKYTDFENENSERPDNLFAFQPAIGDSLDINNLDQQGYFIVPQPIDGEDAFNAFIQPLINEFGYLDNGVPTGGGRVGGYFQINDQDFFRESFEIAYDRLFYIGNNTLDFHVGYQYMEVSEDLARQSNGWGSISVPGGRALASDGVTPIFYEARVSQQGLLDPTGDAFVESILSESEMQSFEVNAEYITGAWTFNVGVMLSKDELYGQGLAPNAANPLTGLEQSPGTRYKMYTVDWEDMIQPRLGVTWDYSDSGSVFVNYARYNPSASSLARAASWDRNLRGSVDVRWDANGNFIEATPFASSSGKFFADDLDPRFTNEWLIGTSRNFGNDLIVRAHYRYRRSENFWEDTNNNARVAFAPPPGIPRELYIPDLDEIRDEIGGSSFVIAELDGAFTQYHEVSMEAEWNVDQWYLKGSYTWSQYYGNFDQDRTTTDNDQATFIGSSNIGDFAGRQLWNFKTGRLGGDRRHQVKVYGFRELPWNARVGAFAVWQSGEPWEAWDSNVYRALTGSTSDTIRYAEPAGTRTSPSHWQLDLNYTQNFAVFGHSNIQFRADIFNVFDNQTGYAFRPRVNSAGFGEPARFIDPRRIQLALKYQFN
ncbi:MAG: carboxypeptidase regulatory-like domain-containing protein [Pseudomonadota bacterium]